LELESFRSAHGDLKPRRDEINRRKEKLERDLAAFRLEEAWFPMSGLRSKARY